MWEEASRMRLWDFGGRSFGRRRRQKSEVKFFARPSLHNIKILKDMEKLFTEQIAVCSGAG